MEEFMTKSNPIISEEDQYKSPSAIRSYNVNLTKSRVTWDSNLMCPNCYSKNTYKCRFFSDEMNKCDECFCEFTDQLKILDATSKTP